MQWNARSAVANKHSLNMFLSVHNVDIALISETWFKPGVNVSFNGYHIIRKDRFDGKAGVAILIKAKIPYKEINIVSNFDSEICACAAKVFVNTRQITLTSVYRPPNVFTETAGWENLFAQFSCPLIIGGDFNAHNRLWGSSKNDSVGDQILEVIDNRGYIIVNNGSDTRVGRPGQKDSAVDITFCSPGIVCNLQWDVSDDTLGSDHLPILMSYEMKNFKSPKIISKSKWNVKKADWGLYTHIIEQNFQDPPSFNSVNDQYGFLTGCIENAASQSIPQLKPFTPKLRPPPPWWNNQCDLEIEKRKQALKRYKQQPNDDNYLNCLKINASTKRFLKATAKQHWVMWCSKLSTSTHHLLNCGPRQRRCSGKIFAQRLLIRHG